MKYIITTNQFDDEEAILFDECLDHSSITVPRHIVSAGFCSLGGTTDSNGGYCERTTCWGKSVTLGVGSRQSDAEVIDQAVNRRL